MSLSKALHIGAQQDAKAFRLRHVNAELLEALEGLTLLISNCAELYDGTKYGWLMKQSTYKKAIAAIRRAKGEL